MAAERIHKALKLPGGVKGALRVLEFHPLLNPAAYVSANIDPDFVHVRRSPAYEDGSWISLVSPVADLPLQAIVAAVDPHLRAEVTGTESDWTVRVIETDTAGKGIAGGRGFRVQRRRVVGVRGTEVSAADGGLIVGSADGGLIVGSADGGIAAPTHRFR